MKNTKLGLGARRSFAAPILGMIAIVISLGGVSYAAIKLPPKSVGPTQLKAKAVGPRALSFPVGLSGTQSDNVGSVITTGFCVAPEGGGSAPPCVPNADNKSLKTRVSSTRAGMLHVSGNVNLVGKGKVGHPEGSALVNIGLELDGTPVSSGWKVTITPGEHGIAPFEAVLRIKRGTHEVAAVLGGEGYNYVNVDATTGILSATVLRKAN